jgi:hypothetical protein
MAWMKLRNLKIIALLIALNFTHIVFAQTGTIKVKKTAGITGDVGLSLAKINKGSIKVANLLKDPFIRIENDPEKKFTITSGIIVILTGGLFYEFAYNTSMLSQRQIELIQSARPGTNNFVYLENIIVSDENGKRMKLPDIKIGIIH